MSTFKQLLGIGGRIAAIGLTIFAFVEAFHGQYDRACFDMLLSLGVVILDEKVSNE